jgi:membrane protease YdiL (CAAX protease family)
MSAAAPPAPVSAAPDEAPAAAPAPEHPGRLLRVVRFPLTRIVVGLGVCGFGAFAALAFFSWTLAKPVAALLATGVLLPLYALLSRILEQRRVRELALRPALPETALGFALGVLLIGGTFAVFSVLGCYRVEALANGSGLLAGLALLAFFATVEEVLFRAVLYRIVEESLGTWLALVISATLFGAAHIMNPSGGVVSAFSAGEAGVLLGLAFTLRGRLWLPIGLHTAWNFVQVALGTPVSGIGELSGNMLVRGTLRGPVWLTGGGYGSENSAVSLAIVLLGCIAMATVVRRRNLVVRPFWRRRARAVALVVSDA